MTKEVAEKIVRGITDKIECNTVDIDDWAEFWGFTKEEYEEFLDVAIKGVKELQAHREAWEKMETELNAMTNRYYVTRFDYAIEEAIDVVKEYRPKEGENE